MLAACLPGRLVVATHEALFGLPRWQFLVGGFAGDMAIMMPIVACAFLVHTLAMGLLFRANTESVVNHLAGRLITSTLVFLLWLATLVFSNGAAEFKSRVGRRSCLRRPPTDPDVQNSRIRLFGSRVCYVAYRCTMRGCGSGRRFSRFTICVQLMRLRCERRDSHLRQIRLTS